MTSPKFPAPLIARGAAALLFLAASIALPTPEAAVSPHHWLAQLFPDLSLFLFSSIRQFAVLPLTWGFGFFFFLGWMDWRAGKALFRPLRGRAGMAAGAVCLILGLALIYWTSGFVILTVWPPLPFGVGLTILDHPDILSFLWCVLALLGQCILEGRQAGQTEAEAEKSQ